MDASRLCARPWVVCVCVCVCVCLTGTTMSQIVSMVRNAGAAKVYLASSAPPVRYPNVYGVDMPTRKEFVAHQLTEAQVSGPFVPCY